MTELQRKHWKRR